MSGLLKSLSICFPLWMQNTNFLLVSKEILLFQIMNACNFINRMSASRPRSASVTPKVIDKTDDATNNNARGADGSERRASSSNNLTVPSSSLTNKSASGNHLAVGVSSETICSGELTQKTTSRRSYTKITTNNRTSDLNNYSKPLEVDISDNNPTFQHFRRQMGHAGSRYNPDTGPISFDILNADYEDPEKTKIKELEDEVKLLEKIVEELERKRFAPDVSQTLVSSVIVHRKMLRDIDLEIYKVHLESTTPSECSESYMTNYNNKSLDDSFVILEPEKELADTADADRPISVAIDALATVGCGFSRGRFGSRLEPGQENTADILDAIPPSSSLQHRQYLNRASTGTDYSEYSQMPSYNQYKHQLPQQQQQGLGASNKEPQNSLYSQTRSHNNIKPVCQLPAARQQQQTSQGQNSEVSMYSYLCNTSETVAQQQYHPPHRLKSPVRPDHFKDKFKTSHHMIVSPSQDSSSASSSSESRH